MAVFITHPLFCDGAAVWSKDLNAGDRGARRTSLAQLSRSDASHFRLSQLDRRHLYGPVITTISLERQPPRFPGNPIGKRKKRARRKNFPVLGLHGARSNFAIERYHIPIPIPIQALSPNPFHHSPGQLSRSSARMLLPAEEK